MSKTKPCRPPVAEIVRVVCQEYKCKEEDLKSRCRKWETVDAKQTVCFLRMAYGDTAQKIGSEYGFSHPAILHNRKTAISKLTPVIPNTDHYYYKPFKTKFDGIAKQIKFDWNLLEIERNKLEDVPAPEREKKEKKVKTEKPKKAMKEIPVQPPTAAAEFNPSFLDANKVIWRILNNNWVGKRSVFTADGKVCWLEETKPENVKAYWCGNTADYKETFTKDLFIMAY